MGSVNMAPCTRDQALSTIESQEWDMVVIGGGITGAGVAQQAARHGWKVLLVEQRDFAWGTSSRSSKLVHGGLRYLKEGDIKTTLHSVRERQRLMREAPELVEPQSFLFSDCAGRKPGRWLFQLGLQVYDYMAGHKSHFYAPLLEVHALAPGLNPPQLRGAMVFTDAKTDDARLVWRVLLEARRDGAVALNYVAAKSLDMKDGRVREVMLEDALTGQAFIARTSVVMNATGAWADVLRQCMGAKPVLRPLRGSHLVVPYWRLPVAQSVSLMHPRDGRPVFLYPWEGVTLIGTTDLDHHGDLHLEPRITHAEMHYLLEAVNDQFPAAMITAADVSATYAGVRPVVDDGTGDASKATRDHVVLNESGLITLTGGKLTTFRLMAQDALVMASGHVGKVFSRDDQAIFTPTPTLNPRWSASVRHRLSARYGYLADALTGHVTDDDLACVPGTHTLWIELAVAAQAESVVHLDDLLLRRTRLGLLLPLGGLNHLPRIRTLCEPHLTWNAAEWESEIERYRALVTNHYAVPCATTTASMEGEQP